MKINTRRTSELILAQIYDLPGEDLVIRKHSRHSFSSFQKGKSLTGFGCYWTNSPRTVGSMFQLKRKIARPDGRTIEMYTFAYDWHSSNIVHAEHDSTIRNARQHHKAIIWEQQFQIHQQRMCHKTFQIRYNCCNNNISIGHKIGPRLCVKRTVPPMNYVVSHRQESAGLDYFQELGSSARINDRPHWCRVVSGVGRPRRNSESMNEVRLSTSGVLFCYVLIVEWQ